MKLCSKITVDTVLGKLSNNHVHIRAASLNLNDAIH